MQPSEYEIQREVEALLDIRRRSTAGGPGSLILDPDLPSSSSQPAPNAYWSPTDDSSSGTSHDDESDTGSSDPGDDPFHLFWVPARLHPEIAPQEFRAFLKEHARAPGDEGVLERSASVGSIGLDRKKSMLSRQYRPSANDGVEDSEETVVPIRRNRMSILSNPGPQLTINDLQKLEALAEEASASDDPTRLRSVLRRSLSLNVAPSALDQMDDMPDMGDDADAPIIVPRPGQILRRAARTKIRKPGQTGEGAHRFTTTRSRRKSVVVRAATVHDVELRTSSDLSSSDHGDVEPANRRVEPEVPEVPPLPRPESYSEESLIYAAYASEEPDDDMDTILEMAAPEGVGVNELGSISPPSSTVSHSEQSESGSDVASLPPASPVLHHPQPHRAVLPPATAAVTPSSPSPSSDPPSPAPSVTTPQPRPSLQESVSYQPPTSTSPSERRDKDRKGLFGKWGSDKGGKKNAKEREKEKEKEKEKETGFFGSLFGGGKKKQEDVPPALGLGGAGRETAAALLGASKSSKNHVPSPSPQLNGAYARYPIHVERAIYRLSHIKLANPRRPLYEQVLISNLMFWYLGVINKTQNQPDPGQAQNAPSAAEKEQAEREAKEHEERERAEKERLERDQTEQKKDQRRGSLTKSPPSGSPTPGARRAEMPVRGPQYEMQHREMEQQYAFGSSSGAGGSGAGRAMSPANGSQVTSSGRVPAGQASMYGVQLVQPQPQAANQRFYEGQPQQYPAVVQGSPQLPPGAMPPVAVEQTWIASAGSPPLGMRNHSSPSPPPRTASPPNHSPSPGASPRRARSPPNNRYTPAQEKQPFSGRTPGRSLSTSVSPPMPQMNGKVKKGISTHAVVQSHPHRKSEDEDVPLAVWQQQQRRK